MTLKQDFEKRGDHWIARNGPADRGGGPTVDELAVHRKSSGQQIRRPAS
jgi:hypothetical protein